MFEIHTYPDVTGGSILGYICRLMAVAPNGCSLVRWVHQAQTSECLKAAPKKSSKRIRLFVVDFSLPVFSCYIPEILLNQTQYMFRSRKNQTTIVSVKKCHYESI